MLQQAGIYRICSRHHFVRLLQPFLAIRLSQDVQHDAARQTGQFSLWTFVHLLSPQRRSEMSSGIAWPLMPHSLPPVLLTRRSAYVASLCCSAGETDSRHTPGIDHEVG